MMMQSGFFDYEEHLASLSKAGDPLEGLSQTVDFEIFHKALVKALKYSDRREGGRPPFDPVLMFKILILEVLYDLSDDKTEFMIRDCLSFMRFLGLGLSDTVPDAKTIWLFRERLKEQDVIEKLFACFDRQLEDQGLLALGGQIMDASIIEAPRRGNTDKEKDAIKAGDIPKDWQDRPAKIRNKVEHVFADQKHRTGLFIRSVGVDRVQFRIGMANIVYNMQRLLWLSREKPS